MRSPCAKASRTNRRRGVISMELALTLPILSILLLAIFEFAVLFTARSQVVEASRIGARLATLPGTTPEVIESEIRRVLSPGLQRQGLEVYTDLEADAGEPVTVGVEVPMTAATPDLLWVVGVSLRGRTLYSETRMIRE